MARQLRSSQGVDEVVLDVFEEYEEILRHYRRRNVWRGVAGVALSVLVHVVLVLVGFYVIVIDNPETEASLNEQHVIVNIDPIPAPKRIKPPPQEPVIDDRPLFDSGPAAVKPTAPDVENQVTDKVLDLAPVPKSELGDLGVSPMPLDTPLTLDTPGYPVRDPETIETAPEEEGVPDPKTEVLKALRWLKQHQEDEGYWLRKHNAEEDAITGLALLAFLAHGELPDRSEEFGLTVQRTISYLVRRVEANPERRIGRAYTHGIVAYALAEAYGLTRVPELRVAAQNAVEVVVRGQQPGGGYDYRYAKENRWDLSVASWQFQAMKAASLAGLDIPGLDAARDRGLDWLRGTVYRDAAFGYNSPGGSRLSMSAAGTLLMQFFGEGHSGPVRATLERRLLSYEPEWVKVNHNSAYTWYYLAQAIYQSRDRQFRSFYTKFHGMLAEHQAADGHWESPDKGDKPNATSARDVYLNTTLNCLSLQVIHRYLPTNLQVATRPKDELPTEDDPFDFGDIGIEVR